MEKAKIQEIKDKLGKFIKVEPIILPRSGEAVRNQYKVRFENGNLYQSYDTLIGIRTGGKLYLTRSHEYSTTTSKYCREWCGYSGEERRKGLESGKFVYLVED